MYVAVTFVLFYINNMISCVPGHQAVLVLEVYKHVTVELLVSLQQMNNIIYNHDTNIVILSFNS